MNNRPATNYFTAKHLEALSELRGKGFPIPPALTVDEPQPLALTTRADIGAYVEQHGGGEDEVRLLNQVVAALVRTPRYVEALAADLSVRVSILTGEPHGLVSEMDRHSAAMQAHARALRGAAKPAGVRDVAPGQPKPPPPQPPKPPAPPPAPQKPALTTPPSPGPFRNGGPLSAAEVERRKQALAALKPKTTTVESA